MLKLFPAENQLLATHTTTMDWRAHQMPRIPLNGVQHMWHGRGRKIKQPTKAPATNAAIKKEINSITAVKIGKNAPTTAERRPYPHTFQIQITLGRNRTERSTVARMRPNKQCFPSNECGHISAPPQFFTRATRTTAFRRVCLLFSAVRCACVCRFFELVAFTWLAIVRLACRACSVLQLTSQNLDGRVHQ